MFIKRFGPYFSYLKPVRKQFALGLGFGLISAAASGAGLPFIIQYLVPLVTSDDKPQGMALILLLSSIPLAFITSRTRRIPQRLLHGVCRHARAGAPAHHGV